MVQKQKLSGKSLSLVISALLVVFVVSPLVYIGHVAAAPPFTEAFLRLDTLTATTATSGRVCAERSASASGTESTVKVTFPTTNGTSYVVNGTAANWTVTTTGLDTGQTAWPGIGTATAVSGNTVTFPSTTLTAGILYCFNFSGTNTLTTPSAGATETTQGNIATYTTGATLINQTTYAESPMITNNSVVVNAVVPPSFTFTLAGNTDSFTTNLSTSSIVSTTGENMTITTNAPNGWIVWAKDLNGAGHKGALESTTAGNYLISGSVSAPAASRTFTTGTEDYGMGVTVNTDAAGGGTVSVNSDYDGTSNKAGTIDPSQFQPIASSNGTANGDIINEVERATIAGQTPAASDYTDTIYFVGAGVF